MADHQAPFEQGALEREVRTPRAAAIAGILFAVLLSVTVILLHWGMPANGLASNWLTNASRRRYVGIAMSLVPYAGIAFLWFIGVIRSRLGTREDKLFATVFLGSGLLFIAMLFTAAAITGALLHLYDGKQSVSNGDVRLASALSISLLSTFGIRMAAVFTFVVTNLGRRTGIVPGWLVVCGYLTTLILLFSPPRTIWATLLFPAWVFVFSVHLLVVSFSSPAHSSDHGGATGDA